MPIPATPVPPMTAQLVETPDTTNVYGQPNLAKLQSIETSQGAPITVNWVMKDTKGNPVNLIAANCTDVTVRIRETVSSSVVDPPTEIDGSLDDPDSGQVSVTLTEAVVATPGISYMEWAALDTFGNVIFTNLMYLIVNRGLFGSPTCGGPPTIAEIRLHLRDSSSVDNFLLDDVEFDLAEISACIMRPIEQFNDMNPPLNYKYNTSTFPWRFYWLEGITANILTLAAHKYRRNFLPSSVNGVSVDDQNKFNQYMQAAELHRKNWMEWAQRKKVTLNMEAGWGTINSAYSYWYGNNQ